MLVNDRFARYLIDNDVLGERNVNKALKACSSNYNPLFVELINLKLLSEEDTYSHLSRFMHIQLKNIQYNELDLDFIEKFPRGKLIEYKTFPYEQDEENIYFAICSPLTIDSLDEFRLVINKNIQYFLITKTNMDQIIGFINNQAQKNNVIDEFEDLKQQVEIEDDNVAKDVEIDAPIIKLCDSILKDAISRHSSDIHIEPFSEEVLLRYRIDGKLVLIDRFKKSLFNSLLARYKIMAGMNIAERRIPQDGKIRLEIDSKLYDFRVSTIPTINGEKVVIRIFSVSLRSNDMGNLGFDDKEKKLVTNMITRPHGIILLTGPTGSGKSTTLYTFLRYLNKEDTNIITVEDPVENQINGVNQVQVNPKANMTFASALRSILRQDPNIIMIGEIRDEETAQIATRAAITGHLVLSTLHTNSATGVVSRLVNMGVAPYLVADSLLGSISQRLVRKLCPYCKKAHITTKEEMKRLKIKEPITIYEPVGCNSCNNTGYNGRMAVFEILVCDDKIRNCIMSNDFTTELLDSVASKTMISLQDNCIKRVIDGTTSINELSGLIDVVEKV